MKYFIDTNVIINLLNNEEKTIKQIKDLLLEEESELFINRLVLTESLRTIHFKHTKIFEKAEETLAIFEKLEIKKEVYDRAIIFSRFCHSKGIKLKGKCEAIDFLHFMTAKYYELEMITNDGDFEKLQVAYEKFIQENN